MGMYDRDWYRQDRGVRPVRVQATRSTATTTLRATVVRPSIRVAAAPSPQPSVRPSVPPSRRWIDRLIVWCKGG